MMNNLDIIMNEQFSRYIIVVDPIQYIEVLAQLMTLPETVDVNRYRSGIFKNEIIKTLFKNEVIMKLEDYVEKYRLELEIEMPKNKDYGLVRAYKCYHCDLLLMFGDKMEEHIKTHKQSPKKESMIQK